VPEFAALALGGGVRGAAGDPLTCDILLVDGDHTAAGASADLHNLRAVASPSAVVIVDDTAVGPGLALKQLERAGAMHIKEAYGPWDPPSPFNRCLRTYNRGPMCLPWGFSIAEYVTSASIRSPVS